MELSEICAIISATVWEERRVIRLLGSAQENSAKLDILELAVILVNFIGLP